MNAPVPPAASRTGPGGLHVFTRDEFLTRRFRYRPGEHVTLVGPTGCGKTWLAYQLLATHASRKWPCVTLVKKPVDYTTTMWGKRLGLRTVQTWPPVWSPWKPNDPPGWVVWPRTKFDPELDRPYKASVFRKALMNAYRGNGIFRKRPRSLFVDDAYGFAVILDLDEELIELWTEARAMGCGLWTAFQRPSHVPLWAYSQAEHLFLFNDPDKRARERFAEIGGLDATTVRDTVMSLERHQALYIRRDGRRMCIVDA